MSQPADQINSEKMQSFADKPAEFRRPLGKERGFTTKYLAEYEKGDRKSVASECESSVQSDMLSFIASAVNAEPELNKGLLQFRTLLESDYQEYANQNAFLVSRISAMRRLQHAEAQIEQLTRDTQIISKTIVAVGGAFSSGKSSFMNSFFSQGDVLPCSLKPTTAIASYVLSGESTEITGYTNRGARVAVPEKIFGQLSYMNGLRLNMKRIIGNIVLRTKFVHPYENICFIDTPGFNPGSCTELDYNTAITAISDAQALIWCFDADGGTIHDDDFRIINDILDAHPDIRIYIVANRADLKHPEENEEILAQAEDMLVSNGIEYEGICLYSSRNKKFSTQLDEFTSSAKRTQKRKTLAKFLAENNKPDNRKEDVLLKEVLGVFNEYINADEQQIRNVSQRIQELSSARSTFLSILRRKDELIDDLKSKSPISDKELQSMGYNSMDGYDDTEDDCDVVSQVIRDSIQELMAIQKKARDDKSAAEELCRKFERCIRGIFGDRTAQPYARNISGAESESDEADNAGKLYELGEKYYSAQDYGNAFRMFRKAADKCFAKAQNSFGLLYLNGYGVHQNYAVAMKWFGKAAEQGDGDAMNNLGNMYYNGQGVDQNYNEALKWYKKSVAQGNADAQLILGNMYYNGQCVVQSYVTALIWYNLSAEQGNAGAQFCLGNMYRDGHAVEQDYAEALRWYRKSAEQENADAQLSLGNMYHDGLGVGQNSLEALVWYMKSAEQGNAEAQLSLANLYYDNANYTHAVLWYQKSAGQGNADAQYRLGRMYENGEGVNKSYAEAYEWYQKSAGQGNADASAKMGDADELYRLGKMYYDGQGVEQDYPEAFKWFKKSAELGNAYAHYQLFLMYGYGQGVERDNDEALKWLKKYHDHKKSPYDLDPI